MPTNSQETQATSLRRLASFCTHSDPTIPSLSYLSQTGWFTWRSENSSSGDSQASCRPPRLLRLEGLHPSWVSLLCREFVEGKGREGACVLWSRSTPPSHSGYDRIDHRTRPEGRSSSEGRRFAPTQACEGEASIDDLLRMSSTGVGSRGWQGAKGMVATEMRESMNIWTAPLRNDRWTEWWRLTICVLRSFPIVITTDDTAA